MRVWSPFSPLVLAAILAAQSPELRFFENEVRPILANRCFSCHGPEKQKSGMRLDHIDYVLKGGERGAALVPGEPGASRMIQAIGYTDVHLQMPPKHMLPAVEINVLRRWVAMGAPWPEEPLPNAVKQRGFDLAARKAGHWAWQPRRRENPPVIADPAWRGNAIDRFILSRLRERNLTPAPPADRITWLRRVTFDLTGLPPTTGEVDAFVADHSPSAFERVVDRLLGSKRYGEHWGRHWLDLVRYAETLGHEFDYAIPNAWRYRDYVIRALNADVPYDEFVTEHIAGDLLPEPRRHPTEGFNESLIGTAFWWFAEQSHSPVDVRKSTADRTDNQIDVFSKAFLGLTVSCARCHDHKFDAIPTSDYYALSGFLKSSRYMQRNIKPTFDATALRERHALGLELRAAWAARLRELTTRVRPYFVAAIQQRFGAPSSQKSTLDADELQRWVDQVKHPDVGRDAHHPLHAIALLQKRKDAEDIRQTWHARLRGAREQERRWQKAEKRVFVDFAHDGYAGWRQEDVAFGKGPIRGQTMIHSDWIRTAVHPGGDARSDARGLEAQGVLHSQEFTIDTPYLHVLAHGRDARIKVVLEGFHLIRNPIYGTLKQHVNSTTPRWYTIDLRMWQGKRACLVFCDQETHDLADKRRYRRGAYLAVRRAVFSAERPPHPFPHLDRVVLPNATADSIDALVDRYLEAIRCGADELARGEITEGSARLLNWFWAKNLLPPGKRLEALRKRYLDKTPVPRGTFVPAIAEGSGLDEHIFIRGGHNSLGKLVPRRFLSAIAGDGQAPIGKDRSGRLELAARVFADDDPLASRVIVNRLWHHLFGRGIVPTVDNFGVLGEKPSHPELLDWLARQFVRDGWSMKTALRRMVLSRTYRMASTPQPPDDNRDPILRWRHRTAVRRLTGESIRDAMLACSGRLDTTMFGPSVPVHLTKFMSGRGRPRGGPIDGKGRRSIYLSVSRNFLSQFMLAFDMPAPAGPIGRRAVTNVPAQALAMLNDPFVQGQAAVWAKRVLSQPGSPNERIRAMYRDAYARLPSQEETTLVLGFLNTQARTYGCDLRDPRPWRDLCHTLWNVKEFVFLR